VRKKQTFSEWVRREALPVDDSTDEQYQ